MHECLDDDHAADRALKRVLDAGLLARRRQITVDCERVIDTFEEFESWVKQFVPAERLSKARPVIRRVAKAFSEATVRAEIVAHGPLRLQVLVKK